MRKKKLLIGGVCVLVAALIAGGTLAALTGQGKATNVITTGQVKIQLNDSIEGGKKTSAGYELDNVVPGASVTKDVSVTNTGSGDAWVRLSAKTSISGVRDKSGFSGDVMIIEYNDVQNTSGYWIDGGDGYFYYSKPLKGTASGKAETTAKLFKSIKMDPGVTSGYSGSKFSIKVYAQAVQVKNNNDNGALTELSPGTVSHVVGWPK